MSSVPTTLTGLVLFLVLLLPGFAYVIGKERHGTGQQPTAFRETAAVVAASFSAELVVLLIFAIVRTIGPGLTPNVGDLVRDPVPYLRGTTDHPGHYEQVLIWGAALLLTATALAYVAAKPWARRFFGEYPHSSTVSAWWRLFDTWKGDRAIHVGCVLADGSYVEGYVASFSTVADDQPDRDLILAAPIRYRPRGITEPKDYADWQAVSVSASRIITLFTRYENEPPANGAGAAVNPRTTPATPSPEQAPQDSS